MALKCQCLLMEIAVVRGWLDFAIPYENPYGIKAKTTRIAFRFLGKQPRWRASPAAVQYMASALAPRANQDQTLGVISPTRGIHHALQVLVIIQRSMSSLQPSLANFRHPTRPTVVPTAMPPLSTEHVKLFAKESDIGCATSFSQNEWFEKVLDRQEGVKTSERKKHKRNFIQRVFESLTHHNSKKKSKGSIDVYNENCYNEELQQYIAEATANLRYDDDELQDSSGEETSDEDSDPPSISPRNAEIIDYSASIVSIVSISSDKTDEYVEPPVEVPRKYRSQDRQGGVLVAGNYVLFTNWAFKKKLRRMGRLGPLPERGEPQLSSVDEIIEEVSAGMYSGKVIEL